MPREMPITEVMTPDVLTLLEDAGIEESITLLSERGVGGAPVVDPDGRLVGLLDDDDLIVSEARLHAPTMMELLGAYIPLPWENRRFEEDVRHALGRTVAEVMDRNPPSVPVDATVEDAATALHDSGASRLPVVDTEGRVVGVVTSGDIIRRGISRST